MNTNAYDWSDLLTVREVAKMHRVSPASVLRWILRGKLTAARRHGRYLVPRRAALELLEIVEPQKVIDLHPERRRAFIDAETRAGLARHGIKLP